MNNLCRFGNIALEGRKTSLACCSNVRCKSAQGDREKPKGKIKKDKNLRFKRCCQSETKRNLDHHSDETSVVLKALHAVDVLNPRPTTPLDRCRNNGFNSILESVNFIAATPELILPESNQKDSRRRGYHSKNVDDVRRDEAKPQERAYIINVFLNDQKPAHQNEMSDENCLDVHIKDIDVTPDEVCMRKLTENIHKNYEELDKILTRDVNTIDSKDYLTNELKRVWSDVFKRSKSEESIPLKQLKDDDYIEDKPQVELDANQELNSNDVVEKQSSSSLKETEIESIRPNPVLIASQIDEVIRNNSLYKKHKSKRNKIIKNQRVETQKEIPIKIEETSKQLKQELSTKFITDINVINPKGEEIKFTKTPPLPTLKQDEVPAPTPSAPGRVKEMVQNIEKINLKDDNITKTVETLFYKTESKPSGEKTTPRSQEIFDPDPFIDEINKVMLEKSLIEEQINKTKLNEDTKSVPQPESKPISKRIKREWIEVLPQNNTSENLTVIRPVILRGQQRLKHQNTNVQKQIDDVIKRSAESRFHNPENTFQKIVNFWQGFFRENPEGTSSEVYSTKFTKEEPFIDRHTKPTKLDFSENPTMATQIQTITSQMTPKIEAKKKSIYKDNRNKSDLNQTQIKSIVSADEIFSSQYAFQQKSGIRERILPSPQINLFKTNHKKLSYFRGKIDLKRFYSDECKDDKPQCKPTNGCEKQSNKCESEEEIKKISSGVLGCTAKCLTNRVPNEPADPDPLPEICPQDENDPRFRTQVKPIEPKCDIMDQIGQYVSNERAGEEIECYYGDNGYKNLEYFKFYPTSFYDIQCYLAKKRNPQPDPYAHKRAKPKMKKKNPCDHLN